MPELIDLITSNFDYDNFFSAQLTAPMTASDTDVNLDAVPTPSEGVLVIDWDVAASREVIFYTSKTASKVTCPSVADGRGFDDTTATTHLSGANVIMAPVADYFRYMMTLRASGNPVGAIVPYAGVTAPSFYLLCYGQAVSRATYSDLWTALQRTIGTVTITIASPGVVTKVAHGLVTGDPVYLTTTGALPTGLTANTQYYAILVTADTFRLATSYANAVAGTAINTSGSQSGTHTAYNAPYGIGDGSTTFNVPDLRGRTIAGYDSMGGTSANRLTAPSTANSINGDVLGLAGGSETHTILTAELASHTHTTTIGVSGANNGMFHNTNGTTAAADGSVNGTDTSNSTGSDTAHNNVQPTVIMNYVIKY